MASILIRTAIIYMLLLLSLRLMGRREIGQLDASDLVSTLLISELAAIPIDDPDIPLMNAVLPILFILSVEVILSTIKNHSLRLSRTIDGGPSFLIYKGRLLQEALRENRISLSELLCSLRTQGVGNVSEVEYALLEQNGTISVLQADKTALAHPVLLDGELCSHALKAIGQNGEWVHKELKKQGLCKEDVFLMTITDAGQICIVAREERK